MQLASTAAPATGGRTNERRADARLVTLAAECATRLDRVCADWSRTRRMDLAFEVAFGKLRGEMPPDEWATLRSRYERHRQEFDSRLVARAAAD